MTALFFILAGMVGGLLGGMGFGGGTLLIPILTLVLDVQPKLAAWVNLVAFLPTAAVALVVHTRNGLVVWRESVFLLFFAFLGMALAFLLGGDLSDYFLKRAFGWFMIVLGATSLFFVLFGFHKKKN